IRGHGMYCAMQTGARNLTDGRLEAAVAAGLQGLGVSIDGLPELHDRIRGVPGSYRMAIDALRRAKAAGLATSVNTVIGAPTVADAGGNVRDLTVEEIWNHGEPLHFGRLRSVDDLWGFCRTCYYAEVCRGGCTWTADSLFGRPGNNPYCHHRVLTLEKQGLRE